MDNNPVADSSYIAAGLIEDASLFETNELFLAPDIAFYEVINAVWKQQVILRRMADAKRYVDAFMRLIDNGRVQLLRPESALVHKAYGLAVAKRMGFYDAVFVVLAKELGVALKTFDKRQEEIFKGL